MNEQEKFREEENKLKIVVFNSRLDDVAIIA